jgi:GNAT superfamily N-acetyltransferase
MMSQLEPELRVISPDEAPAVISLMRKIGWNHPLEQTRQNIAWGGKGSFCLAFDERIVGTAIALKYSERLAWIGLVISDPEYQRRGFARRLMNHAMQHLQSVESIMLDASTLGFPLYDKMGFQSLYKINVYAGTPQRFAPSAAIRPMTTSDLSTVINMDCEIMGLPRPQVLNWLFENSKPYVMTVGDKITGYAFARVQIDGLRIVAWNAEDSATAEALFQFGSSLAAEGGYGFQASIPELNKAASAIAERHGLTIDRTVTRMVYGKEPPGHMSEQYGIIAFMTG